VLHYSSNTGWRSERFFFASQARKFWTFGFQLDLRAGFLWETMAVFGRCHEANLAARAGDGAIVGTSRLLVDLLSEDQREDQREDQAIRWIIHMRRMGQPSITYWRCGGSSRRECSTRIEGLLAPGFHENVCVESPAGAPPPERTHQSKWRLVRGRGREGEWRESAPLGPAAAPLGPGGGGCTRAAPRAASTR
jgi:hypothetical protein